MLERKTKEKAPTLFDMPDPWEDYWWGMPRYEMGDATPFKQVVVNFETYEDFKAFQAIDGIHATMKSDSITFPYKRPLCGEYFYDGPKTDSRYPVCIPSKGRAQHQKTGKALDRMGVSYKFFVEETEYEEYCAALGVDKVVRLPFHDLGQGSIPARNFIWEWAKERGHRRHWTMDDNIRGFGRMSNNRRLRVYGGGFFTAIEDFVDRYQNIAMAGPHDLGFAPDRHASTAPVMYNTRVYSCILLDTSLPHRWRGRYNEDTDLSLRLLKDGFSTCVFRALLMSKGATVGNRGSKPTPGGNTDNVYNGGDHRLAFAESLKEQHPDVVKVVWKFNRWHHEVDYSPFKDNKPILREGVTEAMTHNDYGMVLHYKGEPICE
jgi:hypothetical protein